MKKQNTAMYGDVSLPEATAEQRRLQALIRDSYIKAHPVCERCGHYHSVDIVYKENKLTKGIERYYDIQAVCELCLAETMARGSKLLIVRR